MNRVRIADIKMLCGKTAVHSDMVKWHFEETVETAAQHYLNTLFGVPQISVMLQDAPRAHLNMIQHYTAYWNDNADLFLSGEFVPTSPLNNYPLQKVSSGKKLIIGAFDNYFFELPKGFKEIDILNAKLSDKLVFSSELKGGNYQCSIYDCEGVLHSKSLLKVDGVCTLTVPKSGLVQLNLIVN